MTEPPAASTARGVIRHSVVYAAARVALSSLDLVLMPVYTRVLGPEEYGLVSVGIAVLAALALVYPAGLDAALGRFYFDHEPGSATGRRTVGTIAAAAIGVGFALAAVFSTVGPGPLGTYLEGMDRSFFRLLVWTGFFNLVMPLWLQLLQVRQEPRRYLVFSVVTAASRAALTVTLVVVLRLGAAGWIQAYLASAVLSAVVGGVALGRVVAPAVDRRVLRGAVAYGAPLLLHQVAGWATAYGGRLVLNRVATLAAVGVYQVGFGIGQVLGLVTTAVNFAYAPAFLAQATRSPEAAAATFGDFAARYLAALVALGVLIALFAREIVAVAAPASFAAAASLVPVIVAAFVAQGFYYVLVNPVFFRKSLTPYLPVATAAGGAATVASSYLLIPALGAAGAAWAGLVGNVVMIALVYPLSQRALPTRYDLRRAALACGAGAVVLAASRLAAGRSGIPMIVVDMVLAGIYLAAVYRLDVVDRAALRAVRTALVGQ